MNIAYFNDKYCIEVVHVATFIPVFSELNSNY